MHFLVFSVQRLLIFLPSVQDQLKLLVVGCFAVEQWMDSVLVWWIPVAVGYQRYFHCWWMMASRDESEEQAAWKLWRRGEGREEGKKGRRQGVRGRKGGREEEDGEGEEGKRRGWGREEGGRTCR